MIAITLMIRASDASLWLEFVRHRIRRFESAAALPAHGRMAVDRDLSGARSEAEGSPEVTTLPTSGRMTC